jgi:HPt (histidine-containing phosphotransfer) domain-containing protein
MKVLMNRHTAAAEIRRREPATSCIPFAALTGDAKKHTRAGRFDVKMDDVVIKPLRDDELQPWRANATVEPRFAGNPTGPAEFSVLDPDVLDNLRDLDTTMPGFLRGVMALFLNDTPARLEEIRAALESADTEVLRRAAHALRGSAGSMGAHGMATACEDLDNLAAAGDLVSAQDRMDVLESEFLRTSAALYDVSEAA